MAIENAVQPIPACPICRSNLVLSIEHSKQKICVCKACDTTLIIPDDAWLKARRMATFRHKPTAD